MADLPTIIQENKKERERLLGLMAGMNEADFQKRLPNGWTISVALAHLAFWDLSQVIRMKRWLEKGVKPVNVDADNINDPLATLSEALPAKAVIKLVTEAAIANDQIVESLTPEQADELLKIGMERSLRRSAHRQNHLEKIEKLLKG